MNIYDLRKVINVYSYTLYENGAAIFYTKASKHHYFSLNNILLLQELKSIGSLDEDIIPEQLTDYRMSQWDALNIAIRFELARETEKKIDNADIGKAIENLKNI